MNSGKIFEPVKNNKVDVFVIILGLFIVFWNWWWSCGLGSLISLNSLDFMMKPDFCAFLNSGKLLIFKKTYFVVMIIWKTTELIVKSMLWERDVEGKNGKNITFGDSFDWGGSSKNIWIN